MPINRRSALKTIALASAATLTSRVAARALAADEDALLHDPLRPAFHYLPARNWMNDPCGPIYFQGKYHLFHQYNPHAAVWGDMHWAHAISPDMIHWERLPIALAPTPGGPDAQGCFTGTAVLDQGRPTFLYTGIENAPRSEATLQDDHTSYRESQCLAIAADDTLTKWKKLTQPVIPTPPPGMKVTGFRDPSPWRAGNLWYAVVGSGIARQGGMVLLYRSPDLRTWEYLHPLYEGKWAGKTGTDPVDSGEMWECPDFFPLTDLATHAEKHVLIHSAEGKVVWQSGTLDRTSMRFTPDKTGELDYGRVGTNRVTYYAPKTQLDARGNRILWGWIAETRPEAEYSRAGWSGLMSLPRLLTLRNGDLYMEPASQTTSLRRTAAKPGQIHELLATFEATSGAPMLRLVSDSSGALLALRSAPAQDSRTLQVSFSNGVGPITITIPAPLGKQATLHAFIDNSVLELFIDSRFCVTHRFYSRAADKPIATITLAGRYTIATPGTYTLNPIWPI